MQNLKHIKKQILDLQIHSNYLEKRIIQQELKYTQLKQKLKEIGEIDVKTD